MKEIGLGRFCFDNLLSTVIVLAFKINTDFGFYLGLKHRNLRKACNYFYHCNQPPASFTENFDYILNCGVYPTLSAKMPIRCICFKSIK